MYNIANFNFVDRDKFAHEYGYEKIYSEKELNIIKIDKVENAGRYKQKKILIFPKEYLFDDGAIQLIGANKKACFLIDVGKIIRTRGLKRSFEIGVMKTFLKKATRFGAYYALSDFSESIEQMRTASEIINVGVGLLGLNSGQAKFGLEMLKNYEKK